MILCSVSSCMSLPPLFSLLYYVCVCVYVCARACVCVSIYVYKRDENACNLTRYVYILYAYIHVYNRL